MDLDVHDSLAPVVDAWDALADRVAASPFLRPGWFTAWWGAFGHGRPAIFAGRREGRLAAVGAFARRGSRLDSLSNVHSPLFALLAEDEPAERELAKAVFGARARNVTAGWLDGSAHTLADAALACGRVVLRSQAQRSPYLRLDGEFASFERSLGRKFVRDLARRRRTLERAGTVTIDVADGLSGLDDLLEEAFRLESSGWKEARGTAIVSQPETLRFYTDLARWAAAAGLLRLVFLRLDGEALAFEYALDDGRAWWFLKGGVAPAHRRFAPGKLLVHAMIERAFATGLERFEFLGADEPWKRDWHPELRDIVVQHAFARTPLALAEGSLVAGYRRLALPLARRTRAWTR